MRRHHGVQSGSDWRKDDAPLAERGRGAQSARMSAEETRKQKIELGKIREWNGWSC